MFNIFKSEGAKRNVAAVFSVLSSAAVYVPALQPYLPIFVTVAGFFGITGLGHAALVNNLKIKK